MGFYRRRILPHLINAGMRQADLVEYRRRVIAAAAGRVLEVGVGSGLNLPFYADRVSSIVAVDPSPELLAMARHVSSTRPVTLLDASAEALPLDRSSVDTVVTTWTLCSIPDVARALMEMRRVLKPEGRLLFVEHGRSPDTRVSRWQDRLTPIWKRIGGGCHLNRAIERLIEDAGFRIEQLTTGYMDGPKPLTFLYEGAARRQ